MLRMISTLALTFSMWSFQTSPPQTSAIFLFGGGGRLSIRLSPNIRVTFLPKDLVLYVRRFGKDFGKTTQPLS